MRIEYVGHATVVVDLDGVRLLTDPLLRNRVAHLRRVVPVDADSRRGIDAVLVSHAHYDHLDLPSLDRLGKKLPVVVPRGLGGMLRKRRFESVLEVELGETIAIGGLEILAVPAEHDAGRGPVGAKADAGRLRHLGLEEGVLRRRHRSLRRNGRTGAGRRRARAHLGLGALGSARAISTRSGRRRQSPSSGPGSSSRSTGARTSRSTSGCAALPGFVDLPPATFVAAVAEAAPDVDVRVLRPGGSLAGRRCLLGARQEPASPSDTSARSRISLAVCGTFVPGGA